MFYSSGIVLGSEVELECDLVLLDEVAALAHHGPQLVRPPGGEDLARHEARHLLVRAVQRRPAPTARHPGAGPRHPELEQVILGEQLPDLLAVLTVLDAVKINLFSSGDLTALEVLFSVSFP